MRRYWTVSSCRGRRGTSLFSRKIHHYFFLSVYLDGFLRVNANRRWLISKKSLESEWTRRNLVIYLSLFFFSCFRIAYLFKTILSENRYRTSMNSRWILQHFFASWKRFSCRGANFDFKYEVNKLFRSCIGINATVEIANLSLHNIIKEYSLIRL